MTKVLWFTLAYDRESKAGRNDPWVLVAQLRDMPAAERSAVVTKEHQRERPVSPQLLQRDFVAIGIEHRDVGRALANVHCHRSAERNDDSSLSRIELPDTLCR